MSIHAIITRSIIGAFATGCLFLQLPGRQAPAVAVEINRPVQQTSLSVALRVRDASLPVTIGIPIAEQAGLTDISRLGVTGGNGEPVPAAFRVLARWRGQPDDQTRPVKWLLVDFSPADKGIHHLRPIKNAAPRPAIERSEALRISNGKLSIEFGRAGEELLRSFQLNGIERLRAGARLKMRLTGRTPDSNLNSAAAIESARIEEESPLRVVVRQDGVFRSAGITLHFTCRYQIYAGRPFVRVQLRLINRGSYGFGGGRTGLPPFAGHARLRKLSFEIPTIEPGQDSSSVITAEDAQTRLEDGQSGASIAAGAFEVAVPEFVENFPRALIGNRDGLSFEILPEISEDHVFDGARAKTVDFYLGEDTLAARRLTSSLNASLEPAYVASTGAVRPSFVEKREWRNEFGSDRKLIEAARRIERMFAAGYAVEATEGAGGVPPQSIFEYRLRGENGRHFGWRNFGDLAWGDGYANLHYDLPFILLRESLRTADERAFRIGSEMARYRADWGQHQADDYLDRDRTLNLRGMAFYEKGDHGSFREPVPSHMWIEGLWLHWAMTGDWNSLQSAIEGSEAFARMNFTYDNALGWNEPRWVGWPILGLVTAWRYSGRREFIEKARAGIDLLLRAEEEEGRKGYFIGRGSGFGRAVQPWAWGGYSMLGVIEYWRDTGDRRVAGFLLRVADWLTGRGSSNPPLKPGRIEADGTRLPAGVSYFWYPDKVAEDRSVALAGLCLPLLTTAARISGRQDLWESAQELFADFAFYRDLPDAKSVNPADRGVINFRSLQFPGSAPKVYGQMGLTVQDFLSDYSIAGKKEEIRERKEIK
ncbi:MAG: hypothetical protein IPM66_12620 [Acidobacteriota bacterium]|nr:MAG: hypothetical protein IPM66_12620 [Acidobacteriota bacterium]